MTAEQDRKLIQDVGSRSLNKGLIRRAFDKLVWGPIKYRSASGYDARRYWDDRLSSYGLSLQGVGHEGMSESANKHMYAEAAAVFTKVVSPLIGEPAPRTLEVGPGTGFYTEQLRRMGVTDYTGVDITSALFNSLGRKFPGFTFKQADITRDAIEGLFDLVVMIDVTEHIVTEEGIRAAIEHVKTATRPGGHVVVGPQFDEGAKRLFYVHFWSVAQIQDEFSGWHSVLREDFREGKLLAFRKPA